MAGKLSCVTFLGCTDKVLEGRHVRLHHLFRRSDWKLPGGRCPHRGTGCVHLDGGRGSGCGPASHTQTEGAEWLRLMTRAAQSSYIEQNDVYSLLV